MSDDTTYSIEIQQQQTNGQQVNVIGYLPETLKLGLQSTWEAPFAQGLMGMMPGSIAGAFKMFGVRPATQLMTLQVWQASESQDLSFDLEFVTESDPVKDVYTPVMKLMRMALPSVDTGGFMQSPGPTLDPKMAQQLMQQVGEHIKQVGAAGGAIVREAASGLGGAMLGGLGAFNGKTYDQGQQLAPTEQRQRATDAQAQSMKSVLTGSINNRISIRFGRFMFLQDVVVVDASPDWSLKAPDAETGLPSKCTVSMTVRPLFMLTQQDLSSMFPVGAGFSLGSDGRGGVLRQMQRGVLENLPNMAPLPVKNSPLSGIEDRFVGGN